MNLWVHMDGQAYRAEKMWSNHGWILTRILPFFDSKVTMNTGGETIHTVVTFGY